VTKRFYVKPANRITAETVLRMVKERNHVIVEAPKNYIVAMYLLQLRDEGRITLQQNGTQLTATFVRE